MFRVKLLRWLLLASVAGFVTFARVFGAIPAPAERLFNLPAGDAATTLKQFVTQAGEQIVYLVDNVRGERTRPLNGRFTPRDALDRMLAGTALTASQDPTSGALVVGRREPRPRTETNGPPAGTRRVSREQRPATQPAATDDLPDAIVKLSSFAVRADPHGGYRATQTLAGTRLSSELKDLAASISVATKDFMRDVHATDLTSLLVYTLGTEVGGYGGNFSDLTNPEAQGVFDDALGQASPGTRIRGLIHADRTRNYFLTDIPIDSYNLERVEISRGANANLFGLGSPAGIINASLIAADLDKNATSITTSLGSYSSQRATLDHNYVLAHDTFALRIATVFDHTRYRTEFAHEKKRGITLAATYQPFKATSVRVSSELGRNDSNRPEQRPPFDRLTWWWAAGKPVWDPAAPGGGAGRLLGTPQAPFTTTTVFTADGARQLPTYFTANWGGSAPNEPMLFYLDPNRSTLGGLAIGGGQTVDGVKSFAETPRSTPPAPPSFPAGSWV